MTHTILLNPGGDTLHGILAAAPAPKKSKKNGGSISRRLRHNDSEAIICL